MMFRAAVVAMLASAVSASFIPGDVPADSELGARMLKSATVVEPARHLNDERDVTFIANYSLRYLGCASLVQISEEGGNNNNQDGASMLRTSHLARFALCPTASCSSSCKGGGEYVVNMLQFVDTYTEAKLTQKEYECEMIRENCYCDNANDDEVCENQCYTDQGRDDCIDYEGEEEFEIQRYLECNEMEQNNNNNNNGNQVAYYVGPYCATDGKSIKLGVFYDAYCTTKAENGLEAWKTNNYGVELPFSTSSIIVSECMDCKAVDENANENQNQNNGQGYYYQEEYEVTELCEQSYEMAARCEEKMEISSMDTTGCDYINNILPRLESASRSISTGSSPSQGKAAKAFAGIFAFTSVLFAAYAYFLYRKIKRGSVDLSAQE